MPSGVVKWLRTKSGKVGVLSGVYTTLVPDGAQCDARLVVSGCQQERSTSCGKKRVQAVAPWSEAQEYVQQQPVVGQMRPVGRKAMRTKVIH